MTVKRKIADFVCAFLAFSVVLVSITVLTGESFFEGAVVYTDTGITVFGTEFVFDKELTVLLERLLHFNDVIFGKGFAGILSEICGFFVQYIKDGILIAYSLARWAVGLS